MAAKGAKVRPMPPGPLRWIGYVQCFRPWAGVGAKVARWGPMGAKGDFLAQFPHFHPNVHIPAPDGGNSALAQGIVMVFAGVRGSGLFLVKL